MVFVDFANAICDFYLDFLGWGGDTVMGPLLSSHGEKRKNGN
jgi:hypothetical protein